MAETTVIQRAFAFIVFVFQNWDTVGTIFSTVNIRHMTSHTMCWDSPRLWEVGTVAFKTVSPAPFTPCNGVQWMRRGRNQRVSLQKCANLMIALTNSRMHITDIRVVLVSMLSSEIWVWSLIYLLKYPRIYWRNIAVKYAFCVWCFTAPAAGCVAGMCGKWLRNQETPRSTHIVWFHSDMATGTREKYSLHLIFTFFLDRDPSMLELFPVVVFQ